MRVYRFSKTKQNTPINLNPTGTQANFETYQISVMGDRIKIGDAHLNILKEN